MQSGSHTVLTPRTTLKFEKKKSYCTKGVLPLIGPKRRLEDLLFRCCQGISRHPANGPKMSRLTPMYGPTVRCKRFSSIWQVRSCINVYGLRLKRIVLRAIMDISAHATLLGDRLQRALFVWVTSVRMRREDRFLHRRLILSQTSVG
jgi:hypothetical protein